MKSGACVSAASLSVLLVVSLHNTLALVEATADAASPSVGLAAKYPRDAGIDMDPAVLFFEDFESGDFKKWDDYDGNHEPFHLLMAVSGPAGNKNNHVVRLRAPAGEPGGADVTKVLPTSYDRLYARWYLQYEPGFNFNALNHGGGLHAGARDLIGRSGVRPSDWFSSVIDYTADTHQPVAYTYYPGMYQDCADPNGRCWGDRFPGAAEGAYAAMTHHRGKQNLPVLRDGRWYCIEIMMDGGTPTAADKGADGLLNYWIDGEEIGPFNGLWLRTTEDVKLSVLWLGLFHHDGSHSVEGILIDNIVVATRRIGCIERPAANGRRPVTNTGGEEQD
ncbi:MAG: hypothetical protein L0228_07060 [Planctomycetes bacterium]|nr:hypothetical protein [Planctomycetota bacterium]